MNAPSWVATAVRVSVLVTLVYLGLLFVYVAVIMAIAAVENRLRRRQRDVEDYDAVLGSRYTIPVSIIAPSFNEDIMAVPATRSLLDFTYPEFEVIVVDDGSTDGTLSALIAAFDLEPRQVFFRNVLAAQPVKMVYRSRTEPRLIVVSKQNGGKADALNCGINFARYRYLCCVDGDTVFARDALLKAMSLVVKDPGRIVAAASLFGISVAPEAQIGRDETRPAQRINGHLLADFQHLDLMRSFIAYRLAWSRLGCMMCVSGAFGLWRRDVILEMGGFAPNFTCEDIEMTFRIHERFQREERPYRILSLPNMVAQTEGPTSIRSLISQRARWQRVTLETIWHYRVMLGRGRYGSAGSVAFPYYLLFECLAPLFQLLSFATLGAAIAFDMLGWQVYLAFLGIMTFGTAIPTTVAVALHDVGFRDYRIRDLVRMIALGPLDLLVYRPVLAYAGMRGCWEFLRKDKRWNKFERNVRRAAAAFLFAALAPRAGAQSPDSVEQVRINAQAELWSGHAARAAALAATGLASSPDNVDLMVLRASALRQLNQPAQALDVINRAWTLAPGRDDVCDLRYRIRDDVAGTEVAVSTNYEQWRARDPWREMQVWVRRNTPMGAGIARYSRASRFGERDDRFELEVYPRFRAGYLALWAAYAPNAQLYTRSGASAEFFHTFPGAFEGSIGYRFLDATPSVNLLTESLGFYRGNLRFGARLSHARGGVGGDALGLSARRYFNDGVQYVGATADIGSFRDDVRLPQDFAANRSSGAGVESFLMFRRRWVVWLRAGVGNDVLQDASPVPRASTSVAFGVRF